MTNDKYPSLPKFMLGMVTKLDANSHKTDWKSLPPVALRRKLEIELEEFKVAFEFETVEEAQKELIDVANYCFILWDRLEAEKERKI